MNSEWPTAEDLHELAQSRPEELEALRKKEIDRLINSAPEEMQRRLRGLQFQIDCKREAHSTPMGACVAISQMMLESFSELNDALHSIQQPEENTPARRKKAEKPAKVIEFPVSAL